MSKDSFFLKTSKKRLNLPHYPMSHLVEDTVWVFLLKTNIVFLSGENSRKKKTLLRGGCPLFLLYILRPALKIGETLWGLLLLSSGFAISGYRLRKTTLKLRETWNTCETHPLLTVPSYNTTEGRFNQIVILFEKTSPKFLIFLVKEKPIFKGPHI